MGVNDISAKMFIDGLALAAYRPQEKKLPIIDSEMLSAEQSQQESCE
jgi:hypothetical protein